MGISVEGQKCPVCNGYLFDDDDIVFCPVCGAPHHRDCYNAVGKCGLEELHGTEKEYKRPTEQEKKAEENHSTSNAEGPNFKNAGVKVVCPNCQTIYDGNMMACPNCNSPVPIMFTPFGTPIRMDPLGGVPDSARLEGNISAKEVAAYTAVNTPRYVKKFFSLGRKNRISWNWAAFLFPNSWFFYRKIYFPGIMFFILMAISGVMAMAINLVFGGMSFASTNEMAAYLTEHMELVTKMPFIIAVVGSILNLIVRCVAGASGDWIYRKTAIERIDNAKKDHNDEEDEGTRIRKKGGVNLFLGLAGLFGLQWVQSLIFTFL